MEAVFIVKSDEFNERLFSHIKTLLNFNKDLEVTITINEKDTKGILRKETREEYFARLDKAIDNLRGGSGVRFTGEEFEEFSKQLLNES